MTIADQTLETLEFDKIRERLAAHTSFAGSRALAQTLQPSTSLVQISWRLTLTSESRRLLDEHPEATIGGTRDIRMAARHAERGGVLDASSLLEIANTLRSMRVLRQLLVRLERDTYPLLSDIAPTIPELPALETAITQAVDEDGSMLDSASPQLGRIRQTIRSTSGRLQERLHNLVSSSQYAQVLQEALVTVRNGRYVVPIRADKRRSLPGIVQDQSASGATLYIEPLAVVDLNNQLREAQLAEQEEIDRLLAHLSDQVGRAKADLVAGVEALSLIDLGMAQARYAHALRCVLPDMVDFDEGAPAASSAPPHATAPLLLTAARHPLLDQQQVVPTTIWLGGDFHMLLITGPNTGGKTVALKTVGLLALMAQAGLHIPAGEPSRLPIFQQIFADIGDEQSIEQNLSTFSSHMTNIIHILETIDATVDLPAADTAAESEPGDPDTPDTPAALPRAPILVLLDELGAGTDPVEGSALARAIASRLLERGCLTVATTHYAELKAFAHNTPGVQNASVEFDVETLAPTYRLTVGLPGRSNALAIASRLGLDPALIERARGSLVREEMQIEDLLGDIRREQEAAAAERQRAEELREDAEKYRNRLADELREFETTRQERLDALTSELAAELREVQNDLRRRRNESRSAALSRQWAEEAEQRLQTMQSRVQAAGRQTHPDNGQQAPRPLRVGDTVYVRSMGLSGDIIGIDEEDEEADVQVGGFRVRVPLDELRREKGDSSQLPPARKPAPPVPERTTTLPPMPEVGMTFDMRGWRVADVQERLDRYLNDAYLAGLPSVRLIHGKGSGALRQVVREIVQRHPLVQTHSGGGADGGEGVTVARLTEQ